MGKKTWQRLGGAPGGHPTRAGFSLQPKNPGGLAGPGVEGAGSPLRPSRVSLDSAGKPGGCQSRPRMRRLLHGGRGRTNTAKAHGLPPSPDVQVERAARRAGMGAWAGGANHSLRYPGLAPMRRTGPARHFRGGTKGCVGLQAPFSCPAGRSAQQLARRNTAVLAGLGSPTWGTDQVDLPSPGRKGPSKHAMSRSGENASWCGQPRGTGQADWSESRCTDGLRLTS